MQRCTLVLCLALFSCAGETYSGDETNLARVQDSLFEGWRDQGEQNAPPAIVDDAETLLAKLPRAGRVAQTPWPGNHWAMYLDGINHRWKDADTLSPAEKFALAFGHDDFVARASAEFGVDQAFARDCRDRDDCSDGHICAKRRGEDEGKCLETWWGVCDGWSVAAIVAPEPQVPIIYNGVEFLVNDIKALLSVAYRPCAARTLGNRFCDRRDPACDAAGRPVESEARSTNPGAFHVVLANKVGLAGRAFIIDRDPSYRVFNHPVSGYEVTTQVPIQAFEAARLMRLADVGYPFNTEARAWVYVETRLDYIIDPEHFDDGPLLPFIEQYETSMPLSYVLELDAAGAVIGGEWVGESRLLHPDFAWTTEGRCASAAFGRGIFKPGERRDVLELAHLASAPW